MTRKLFLFFILFFLVLVTLFGIHYAAAETSNVSDYVEMSDDFRKKDSIPKLFGVSGHVSSNFANMTVTYPDTTIVTSLVSLTDRGYFQSFILLESDDPAGLYSILIQKYDDNIILGELSTSFFLSDYDGLLDIHIRRNSVLECEGKQEYCTEPGISHIPKSFGVRFLNDDFDAHRMKIGSITGNLILPDGDSVLYPQNTGTHEYFCTLHPWINGSITVSDISSIKQHVDNNNDIPLKDKSSIPKDTTRKNNTPQTNYDYNINNNINYNINYNINNCGMCYVGIVTKIIDGDTIQIDKKSVRLALIDTPEKRQEGYDDATKLVKDSCPIGSTVLVNIDDVFPTDGVGVNFAQITCGTTNINESLMNNNLAKMYDYSCTESEFMYDTWAKHNCNEPEIIILPIVPKNNFSANANNTISQNNTTLIEEIIENNQSSYLLVIVIVILICLVLYLYVRKNQTLQNKSFTNIEFLE